MNALLGGREMASWMGDREVDDGFAAGWEGVGLQGGR